MHIDDDDDDANIADDDVEERANQEENCCVLVLHCYNGYVLLKHGPRNAVPPPYLQYIKEHSRLMKCNYAHLLLIRNTYTHTRTQQMPLSLF